MSLLEYLDFVRHDLYTKARTAVGGSLGLYAAMEILRQTYAQELMKNMPFSKVDIDPSAALIIFAPLVMYVADGIGAVLTTYSRSVLALIEQSLRWISSKEFEYSFRDQLAEAREILINEAESIRKGSFDDAFGGFVLAALGYATGSANILYELAPLHRLLALAGVSAISDIAGDFTRYLLKKLGELGESLDKFSKYENKAKLVAKKPPQPPIMKPEVEPPQPPIMKPEVEPSQFDLNRFTSVVTRLIDRDPNLASQLVADAVSKKPEDALSIVSGVLENLRQIDETGEKVKAFVERIKNIENPEIQEVVRKFETDTN